MAHFRLRADLALVLPCIPGLHVLHLQSPSVRRLDKERLEPVVGYEGVPVHRQNVGIPPSYPRHGLIAELLNLTRYISVGPQLSGYIGGGGWVKVWSGVQPCKALDSMGGFSFMEDWNKG